MISLHKEIAHHGSRKITDVNENCKKQCPRLQKYIRDMIQKHGNHCNVFDYITIKALHTFCLYGMY